MSPIPRPRPGSNVAEFSVSQITGAVKRTLENAYGHVRVRGEIAGYRGPHSSGHAYFSLAEDRARIDAVIWKGTFRQLKFKPEEGMEVVATGKVSAYGSKYQLIIESLEPAGAGALMALLEQRKAKLAAEGLFAEERKRALPTMPRTIGVVTSPTGAVIRDIIHRVRDRFPVNLVVWPVRVQGETSGAEVAAGIAGLNREGPFPRPDLIIVARGGGSLEDLWGFNDEAVVRAAAASTIPLISAVGHETDWTLIDLAADRRAPTPTGAAEIALPVRADLVATVAGLAARHAAAISRSLERKRQNTAALARALPNADGLLALPRRRFDEAAGRLDRALAGIGGRARTRFDAVAGRIGPHVVRRALREKQRAFCLVASRVSPLALERRVREQGEDVRQLGRKLRREVREGLSDRRQELRLYERALDPRPLDRRLGNAALRFETLVGRRDTAFTTTTQRRRAKLDALERVRQTLGYESVLARGYAIVRDENGRALMASGDVAFGDRVEVQMRDGSFEATAGKRGDGDVVKRKKPPRRAKEQLEPDTQGLLL